MDESSSHVSNINRALRNIKSDVMANFVQQDTVGVTIQRP